MEINKIRLQVEKQENIQNNWKTTIPDQLPIQLVTSSDYIQIINSLNASHQIAKLKFLSFFGLMFILMFSLVVSKFPNVPLIVLLCLATASYGFSMFIMHRNYMLAVQKVIFDINNLYTDKQVYFYYERRGISIFSVYSLFIEYPDRDYSSFDDGNNISVNLMTNPIRNSQNSANNNIMDENNFTKSSSTNTLDNDNIQYKEPKNIFQPKAVSSASGLDYQPLLNADTELDFD